MTCSDKRVCLRCLNPTEKNKKKHIIMFCVHQTPRWLPKYTFLGYSKFPSCLAPLILPQFTLSKPDDIHTEINSSSDSFDQIKKTPSKLS